MKTKSVPTFEAKIYVGFRNNSKEYGHYYGYEVERNTAWYLCKDYCNCVGLCVTFTDTEFLYVDGNEKGCVVGLINYPRFSDTEDGIRKKALELGELLRQALSQKKVSVVFPDETIMLYEDEL